MRKKRVVIQIDKDKCTECGKCSKTCSKIKYPKLCSGCGKCMVICPVRAITFVEQTNNNEKEKKNEKRGLRHIMMVFLVFIGFSDFDVFFDIKA